MAFIAGTAGFAFVASGAGCSSGSVTDGVVHFLTLTGFTEGDAEADGFGVGVPPTKIRWKSDGFLGFGVAVGDTEGEGEACTFVRVLTAGDIAGVGETAATGLGDAFTRTFGFADGDGDGDEVGVADELAAGAPYDHCENAMRTAVKAKIFLIMFSLWFTCKSGDIKPSMLNP